MDKSNRGSDINRRKPFPFIPVVVLGILYLLMFAGSFLLMSLMGMGGGVEEITAPYLTEQKTSNLEDLFGSLAMTFGILTTVIGLSAQALKNYNEERLGNPRILAVLSIGVYLSRTAYAMTIHSFYIMIPDLAGIIIVGTILFQWYLYRE